MKMGAGGIITKFQCVIDNAVLGNLVTACFQRRDSQVLADRLTIVADASARYPLYQQQQQQQGGIRDAAGSE